MSAQGRYKRQRRASEPAQAVPFPAGPAGKARKQAQGVSSPFPDSSLSLHARAAPGPNGTRAEEALRGSEERFRRLCEASFEGIVIHDGRKVLDANQALAVMLGYDVSEIIGRNGLEFVAPDYRGLVEQNILSGYEAPYEVLCLRRDGSLFPAEVRGRAIPYDGRMARVLAVRDITERKRAEQALRESEERFRLIARVTSDVTWDWDLTTGHVWRSEGMQRLFGYAPSEEGPRVTWWYERLHPEDRDRVVSGIYAVISGGGESWFGEYRFLRADGSYAHVQERSYVIRDGDGRPVRMIGGMTDITERKLAEEALWQAELRYRFLFEQAPAMYVITRNEDGAPIISDCNDLFLTTLGYDSRAELLGRPLKDFYTPLSRARLLEHGGYQRALEGRFVAEERRLVTRDGGVVETMLRAVPELDADGRTIGTRAMYVDITERKRAEEELSYQGQLLASVNDAIMSTDEQFIVRSWNLAAERIYGWKADEVLGRLAWEVFRSEFVGWPEEEELRRQLVGGERGKTIRTLFENGRFHGELIQYRKDGTPVYVEARGIALRDSRGQITGYVSVNRDITERKRAEEELRESEERFRLIARATSDAIFDCDVATGRVWWGEGVRTLFGFQPGDAAQDTDWWRDQIHPDDRERVFAAARAFMQGDGQTMVDEYRFRRADGSYAYVVDYNQFIRDEAGVAVRLIGGLRDITWRREAEEALAATHARLEHVLRSVPVAVYTCRSGDDFGATYSSENVVVQTGYEAREFLEDSGFWLNHIHPDDRDRMLAGLTRVFETGRHVHEYRFLHKDGTYRWMRDELRLLSDTEGKPLEMIGAWMDITERKRAEEALRESERRYRLLAENARDVIWTMDMNLRTTYVSPSITRLWGYSVEEVMTQTPEGALTPASLDVVMKVFAEEMAREAMEVKDLSRSRTLEIEAICKDGSTVWAEARMTFLRDEDNRPVGILGISRDITERKRAQKALEDSERRYRLLAENASDIIWIRDLDLRATYVNPAVTRIRGYSVEEVLAQTPEEFLTPASLELARKVLAEELAKEQVEKRDLFWWRTLELENTCKDGSTVWLEVRVTALRDDDDRIVGILGISRDISERKRAEEALQEAREDLESRVEHHMRRGSAHGLTFRELTVLHLVAAGKSDKEIASTLGISVLTASKHLANILHKMGAASRTEAGVRALREGLLD